MTTSKLTGRISRKDAKHLATTYAGFIAALARDANGDYQNANHLWTWATMLRDAQISTGIEMFTPGTLDSFIVDASRQIDRIARRAA